MSQIPLINSPTNVLRSFAPVAKVQSTAPIDQKSFRPSFDQAQAESNSRSQRSDSQLRDRPEQVPESSNRQKKRIDIERDVDKRADAPDRENRGQDREDDPPVSELSDASRTDARKPEPNDKPELSDDEGLTDGRADGGALGREESKEDGGLRLLETAEQSLVASAPSGTKADTKSDELGRSSTNAESARDSYQFAALRDSINQSSSASSVPTGQNESASEAELSIKIDADLLNGVNIAANEGESDAQVQDDAPIRAERVATQPLAPSADRSNAKLDISSDRSNTSNAPQIVNSLPADGRTSSENPGERSDPQRQDTSARVTTGIESAPKQTNPDALFQIDRLADAGVAKADYTLQLKTGSDSGQMASQQSSAAHSADGRLVTQSVSRGLAAAIQQNEGEVVLRLSPASLGVVRIKMSLDHGAVSVRLEATTQAAQQAMSDNLGALRNSLESRGLTVDRVSVQHTPLPGGQSSNSSQSGTSQQGSSNQPGAGDQTNKHDAGDAPSQGRRDGGADSGMYNSESVLNADESGESATFEQQFHVRLETVA